MNVGLRVWRVMGNCVTWGLSKSVAIMGNGLSHPMRNRMRCRNENDVVAVTGDVGSLCTQPKPNNVTLCPLLVHKMSLIPVNDAHNGNGTRNRTT